MKLLKAVAFTIGIFYASLSFSQTEVTYLNSNLSRTLCNVFNTTTPTPWFVSPRTITETPIAYLLKTTIVFLHFHNNGQKNKRNHKGL